MDGKKYCNFCNTFYHSDHYLCEGACDCIIKELLSKALRRRDALIKKK